MLSATIQRACIFLGVLALPLLLHAPALAKNGRPANAAVGGATSVPYGWVDFCSRHDDECSVEDLPAVNVEMNSKVMRDITRINSQVNAFIQPMSNVEHWGTILDHWDYPTDGKGDCKIYALYKRKLLLEMGYPRQALLMTVVKDLQGKGHAILTLTTTKGDYILDNLTDDIRVWNETGYTFVKRQSQENPNIWLSIADVSGAQLSQR